MKTLLASVALAALTCSQALAGAGAPVPEKPEGGDPSGRPGAILDAAECDEAWRNAAANDADHLTAEAAGPVVANVDMVDADGDGKITQAEFKDGCKKGAVQKHASKPAESGGGQTPETPEAK